MLSIFIDELRRIACIVDRIADIFYYCVSGCMSAQVAHEVDYQKSLPAPGLTSYDPPPRVIGPSSFSPGKDLPEGFKVEEGKEAQQEWQNRQ